MRERIEQVGDILLAAAHADHHIEAAEIDKIEQILKGIWRQEPSPGSLVRREAREGDTVDAEEMARLGSVLRDLQPREDLPAALVQRLADFDPARFDIDEAVGPFLHEPFELKRRLLELAVEVHEADGELDFAEDTFIRELGYKLGLSLDQFQDLLLEFMPEEPRPAPAGANGSRPEASVGRELAATVTQKDLLVSPSGEAATPLLVSPDRVGAPNTKKKAVATPARKKAAAKKAAARKAPAKKKKAARKPAAKKATPKKKAAKKAKGSPSRAKKSPRKKK